MDRLSGRYRLVDCIGTGGMSVVWLARDEILDRDVVVKLLGPQRPGDTSSRHLIRQEAMAAAALAHPNVTTVYDYGEVSFPEGDTVPFVVMEYVRGRTLSSRLAEGPMPWPEAVRMAAEVSAALAAAHAHGLVHRDVKPGNVMLTPVGVKVLDFGIAAAVGTRDDGTTLLGTPAYVSPERLNGGPVHPAADVYAVGLLLYKALVGRLPWTASTATQILQSHLETRPTPLPEITGMPRRVAEICMSCLAKKPADRPDSATLARELAGIAHARVALPAASAATVPAPPASWRRTGLALWRRGPLRARAAMAGAGLGLSALAVAWAVTPSGSADQAVVEPPAHAEIGAEPISCQVRYRTTTTSDSDYQVDMTIVNTGSSPIDGWTLSFVLPGGQRVDHGAGADWVQAGDTVEVRAAAGQTIAPGSTAAVRYVGVTSGGQNAAPDRFTLNGSSCAPTVVAVAAQQPSTGGADGPPGWNRHRTKPGHQPNAGPSAGPGKG